MSIISTSFDVHIFIALPPSLLQAALLPINIVVPIANISAGTATIKVAVDNHNGLHIDSTLARIRGLFGCRNWP